MMELCPFCGGLLTTKGNGYQCPNCSSIFESKKELDMHKPKRVAPQPQLSQNAQPKTSLNTGSTTSAPAISTNIPAHEQKSDTGVDVFDRNIKGVLEITWSDGAHKYSGSGFLISKDGYAITNAHVVTSEAGVSCRTVNVKLCNKSTTAEVVCLGDDEHGKGKGIDLALIKLNKVPEDATVLQFAPFEAVRNGERVFVIGNSLGYGTCITSGIVSDRLRKVNGKLLLMTDCAVNGGNSGGPIFNEKGLVIGAIVSGITAAEGMNFAIPGDVVENFMKTK